MVESGDWFNLKINGEAYDQKPHLFFWLAGLGVKLFGNTNFAFKLFPFLYGILGLFFTYRLGKTIYSKETGLLAALFAGSSQITFLYFFDFHMDSILQTGVVFSLWQLAEYLKCKKAVNFIGGFVGVGLAMFTKGPIGAVIPFLAVLFYLVAEKDFKQLVRPRWLLGIAIALIIVSPTLIQLYKNFGTEGLKFYFITNNFGRITGEYAGSNTDPFFYLHTLLWAFLPWTIFVLVAIWSEIKGWIKSVGLNSWGFFLLGSTLVLLLVLSIAKGKAPNYFLIAVAPISVVTGKWFENKAKGFKVALIRIHWITVSLYSILLLVITFLFVQNYIVCLIIILIFCFFILLSVKRNIDHKILLVSFTIAACLNVVFNVLVLPEMFKYQGARQAIEIYEENKNEGDKLCNFELEEFEIFFYAKSPVNHLKDWTYLYKAMGKSGTWIYTNSIKHNDIIQMGYNIDTVYQIKQTGMNKLRFKFMNPETREDALEANFLIKTK